jgi:intracellular sulfur oxidation DsrE/DsrF family protein
MTVRNMLTLGVAALVIAGAPATGAQEVQHPAIAGFGAIKPLPDAANRPAPGETTRALFEISSDASGPRGVNGSLDKVARFLNLLASAGVEPHQAQVKVIVHGPATPLVMSGDAYRDRFGTANPHTPLIDALQQAGVEFHVCGQALAGQGIATEAVASGITVDLSAMTTLVLLQQKGWSVVSD